jgi:hypothetical protein
LELRAANPAASASAVADYESGAKQTCDLRGCEHDVVLAVGRKKQQGVRDDDDAADADEVDGEGDEETDA